MHKWRKPYSASHYLQRSLLEALALVDPLAILACPVVMDQARGTRLIARIWQVGLVAIFAV